MPGISSWSTFWVNETKCGPDRRNMQPRSDRRTKLFAPEPSGDVELGMPRHPNIVLVLTGETMWPRGGDKIQVHEYHPNRGIGSGGA